MSATNIAHNRWLYGPGVDLLLGCGIGYGIIFTMLTVAGPQMRAIYPLELLPIIALVLSIPHYGATLLRVYARAEDRRKYRFFSVYLSMLVLCLFILGVHSEIVGSLLITVYITWSPWHYTGQNYGIAVMFLGRRGIKISKRAKRFLYSSFVLSFVLTVVELHLIAGSSDLLDLGGVSSYRFITLGHWPAAQDVLLAILVTAYLYSLFTATRLLVRVATFVDLLPTALLVLTQAVWFLVPMVAHYFGVFENVDSLSRANGFYAFFWVAIGHAVQYLWITSYFALQESRSRNVPVFFARTLLAGASIWVIPAVLFAPDALGRIPYDAGLAALVASAVNIHHFILDGAIWKLRDGTIARILLNKVHESLPVAGARTMTSALANWSLGLVGVCCVLVSYFSTTEYVGFLRAWGRSDLAAVEAAERRLDFLGRESASLKSQLGVWQARQDRFADAIATGLSATRLLENVETLSNLGQIYHYAGDLQKSVEFTWRATLRATPSDALLDRLTSALVASLEAPASTRQFALRITRDLVQRFQGTNARALAAASMVYVEATQYEDALRIAAMARQLAQSNQQPALVDAVDNIVAVVSRLQQKAVVEF